MNQQTNITIHNLIFRIHGLDLYLSTGSGDNNNHFLIKRRALEQTIPYIVRDTGGLALNSDFFSSSQNATRSKIQEPDGVP